jgi:hypothetical protein
MRDATGIINAESDKLDKIFSFKYNLSKKRFSPLFRTHDIKAKDITTLGALLAKTNKVKVDQSDEQVADSSTAAQASNIVPRRTAASPDQPRSSTGKTLYHLHKGKR